MRASNPQLLQEIDALENFKDVDANELEVVKEIDTLTEQVKQLREAVVNLIECKGILTSDKDCVIRAKKLLEQTK